MTEEIAMIDAGVFLGFQALQRLPPDIRAAVFEAAGLTSQSQTTAIAGSNAAADWDGLARFTDRQVRQLLKPPIHDTTRKLLEAVASLPPRFRLGDVLKKLGMEFRDLRGALSGLTRRTRNIANDPDMDLFFTVHEADHLEDNIVEMHPETHAALRRALGM
jgi:hypothetical protein